ncbi:hypothetical protein [Sinobaca sp. H24]|uniref:hypothetical protein n=1 Tax=Sinobaca sp. H24 TaxID=2923376 RepID=UPI00207ADEAF|nr:hypothetical protein [Sinobaca sp. H24]
MLDAFSRAKNLPVSRLLIGTADASIHQLTFYQAMGFHITAPYFPISLLSITRNRFTRMACSAWI